MTDVFLNTMSVIQSGILSGKWAYSLSSEFDHPVNSGLGVRTGLVDDHLS